MYDLSNIKTILSQNNKKENEANFSDLAILKSSSIQF